MSERQRAMSERQRGIYYRPGTAARAAALLVSPEAT
jgi:hypothetical protein